MPPPLFEVKKLAKILDVTTDTATRRDALASVKTLAFDDSRFEELRETDITDALVSAASKAIDDNDMVSVKTANDALWSLSADETNHEVMTRAGVMPILGRLLFLHSDPYIPETAAQTLSNMVDLQAGLPREVTHSLHEAGGIEGLIRLLPTEEEDSALGSPSPAVVSLAALAVDPSIGDEIRNKGGVERLVQMLRAGERSTNARHAAAILARIAYNNGANQTAIREAGGISALLELCEAVVVYERVPLVSDSLQQAAQHGAGALWVLATDKACRDEITRQGRGLQTLTRMVGGRFGSKAEGNAAGALLALLDGHAKDRADPKSILDDVMGYVSLPTWSQPL